MPKPTAAKKRRSPAGAHGAGAKGVENARKRVAQARADVLTEESTGKFPKTLHGAQSSKLRHRACQFPLWGSGPIRDEPDFGKYCGDPIFHRDYCEEHYLVCWAAPMPGRNATRPAFRR
jgi:hypothetical protein